MAAEYELGGHFRVRLTSPKVPLLHVNRPSSPANKRTFGVWVSQGTFVAGHVSGTEPLIISVPNTRRP